MNDLDSMLYEHQIMLYDRARHSSAPSLTDEAEN
jgi:hypothetical protein